MVGLLDLSAAFDYADHAILLHRLEVVFGQKDTVIDWIRSFLIDRMQQVAYYGRLSSVELVLFGVPQGSVLGPLLYVLYTAELGQIVASHGLLYICTCMPTTVIPTSAHPSSMLHCSSEQVRYRCHGR